MKPFAASLLLPFTAVLFTGCASQPAAAPSGAVPVAIEEASPAGLTLEEEAQMLRLEDRRQYDEAAFSRWLSHPNPLHRRRAALALGRIGPSAIDDVNGDGVLGAGETMAGVRLLLPLTSDPDPAVRTMAAFALGEIGDAAAVDALLRFARDEHGNVASEAVEALAKLAPHVPLDRYAPFTASDVPAGIRARTIRFLFRFDSDEASRIALDALGDSDTNIRREASYALSRRRFAPARPALELLLTDPDTLTRAYAVRALGIIADPASLDRLVTALGDAHPWVRTNASRSIAQTIEANRAILSARPLTNDLSLLLAATTDSDSGAAVTAIEPLGWYATVSEAAKGRLLHLAVSGSRQQTEVATGIVARHFGEAEDSPLDPLLQTDARWIKIRALEATPHLPSRGAAIRARFATDDDRAVRAAAIGAIPDDAVDAQLPLVINALGDPDPVVRANAIDRYAKQKSEPLTTAVERLAALERGERGEAMNDARIAAIDALARTDHPGREAFLRALLGDSDPVVRRIAADALVRLGFPRPRITPLPVDRPLSDYVSIAEWARTPRAATIRTDRGDIDIVLLPADAPMTAWNFAQLAEKGYYDGTSFMRVVPNFVIQGGDPRNDMSGGPGYAIRDEINPQKYTRGAVGMALSGPDTGGSQFFITHSPQHHLDGGYTIFGRVSGGMTSVVDAIQRGDAVKTIEIKGGSAATASTASAERVPLPLVVGELETARMLAVGPEYDTRRSAYQPDVDVVQMIASSVQPGDSIEVYLGTWCSDSQREVPKLVRITELLASDYGVEIPVRYVAVSRSKAEPAGLVEGKQIEKVATFIYYRNGTELGRIVETPQGLLEDDLLAIAMK